MRGHKYFYGEVRKIIFELSSVPPLIWISVNVNSCTEFCLNFLASACTLTLKAPITTAADDSLEYLSTFFREK